MEKKKEQEYLDLDAMNIKDETVTAHVKSSKSSDQAQDYNSCTLCGTELIYFHVTDFSDEVVFEESSCPSCNIKSKKKAHRLQ